jgi:fructose-bisphosphate aldolase class II
MPLVSILDELKKAQAGGYAIPCFDTFEQQGTLGIFDAIEAKRAPVMIGLYTAMFSRPHPKAFTDFVRRLGEEATVPVSIILDHGASFEHCVMALDAGFTDVMYDGSKLPFEENVANTRMVVRAAHAVGAAVEAELGHVGTGSTYQEFGAQGKGFTEPDAVVRFVEETGVDFLAIAIGTAHGLYDGEVNLALDLLAKIRERVDIPLVLHGGSGLSDEQFQACVAGGIQKINIFTNLAVASTQRLLENARSEEANLRSMLTQIREGFCGECERLLDVFGTTGKA